MSMRFYALGLLLSTIFVRNLCEDKAALTSVAENKAFVTKGATFDFDEVFAKSLEYQDELERVKKAVKDKEAEFMKLKKEYEDAVAKLQNAGSTMKEDARERTIERVGELRQKMEIKKASLDQYLQREQVTIQSKIMEKIYEAAAYVARIEGWDFVNPLIPKKLVFNKDMDITDRVIKELNKGYKPKKRGKDSKPAVQEKVEQKVEKKDESKSVKTAA